MLLSRWGGLGAAALLMLAPLTSVTPAGVVRQERNDSDNQTHEFDVGPINITGDVYADTLALLAEPFFQRTGRANSFANFRGPTSLSGLLSASADAARKRLAAGDDPVEEDRSMLLRATRLYDPSSTHAGPLGSLELMTGLAPVRTSGVTPEPTVLLLMLLGVPVVLGRRLRR